MPILTYEEITEFDKTLDTEDKRLEAAKIILPEIESLIEVDTLSKHTKVWLSSAYNDLKETIKDFEYEIELNQEK